MAEEGETPKVEETPADAPAAEPAKPAEEVKQPKKNSRAEKKMKDTLLKYNLNRLENVTSVAMRKDAQIVWKFVEPEVYFIENVYVIFGELSVQDAGRQAMDDLKKTIPEEVAPSEPAAKVVEDDVAAEEDPSDGRKEDIETIMQQTNVTRSRAIQALRDAGGDLVTAVMNLAL
jgi:nascent polypeptide-associated complex subunit alpha